MSTFKVEIKKISKIYPHSNADRLELAQAEDMTYQFAVPKGTYTVGDEYISRSLRANESCWLILWNEKYHGYRLRRSKNHF